ncbi:MAG: squalene synthase [Chloroflexi bacterium HGW-Chloroflexi-10]|nr:MAG: squalene synthase [Chloroflexi bacterium HGW-Chloroflexi-10]
MAAVSFTIQSREKLFEQVEEVIKNSSKTFYFATHFLPKKERQAVRALYAFCRTSDDMVDKEGASLAELEAWRLAVRRPASEQRDPVLYCWSKIREDYKIDPQYERELIEGVGADIQFHEFQTWEDLERYCYLVASTVGLLSTPIIGLAPGVSFEKAKPYAIKLGIALQLTNILRDVGEDARNGRVYIPVQDLRMFGLSVQDILNQVYDERTIALMKFEIRRAREIYLDALPGIAMLSRTARPAVGVAAMLYRAILDEIEAIRYQTHIQRAYVSGRKKLAYLPGFLWHTMRMDWKKMETAC